MKKKWLLCGGVFLVLLAAASIPPVVMNRPGDPPPSCGWRTSRNIAVIVQALELYKLEHYGYPTSKQGLVSLLKSGSLKSLLRDEWQRPYIYAIANEVYEVTSLGKDGQLGGHACAADISSVDL